MSTMGVKINEFDFPVCNSFRPKIIRDQLCYTVDPNKFKDKIDLKGELSLTLFIHYNEDRQLENYDSQNQENLIMLETVGKKNYILVKLLTLILLPGAFFVFVMLFCLLWLEIIIKKIWENLTFIFLM